MKQFITMAAEKLGADKGLVEKAIGVVLNLIKDNASGGDFQSLVGKLPGAEALLSQPGASAGPGGGLLGAAAGALGGAMGGGGSTLGALAQLKETGLDFGQLGSLLKMFKSYATEQAGGHLTEQALASIPGLDELTG